MITSSAIELVEEEPPPLPRIEASVEPPIERNVEPSIDPILDDPSDLKFFDANVMTSSSVSSSSMSEVFAEAGVSPRRKALPWLLFLLSVTVSAGAWVQYISPRMERLADSESKLDTAKQELAASKAQLDGLKLKIDGLETEKKALAEEHDKAAAAQQQAADAVKAREELAERLKTAFAQEKRIDVAVLEDAVALRMTTDDVFVFGDVTLKDPALLDTIGGVLKGQGDHRFTIAAHTDATPVPSKLRARYPSNYELSAARAFAVLHRLEAQKIGERIDVVAAAETQPIASNKTQPGRKQNRRIEIMIR
jgi:chemotaxis protein MotB